LNRISRRGVWFAGILLLCFWSFVSHPEWTDDATMPSEIILFLGFIYRWLWPEKISARGIWFAAALFICWYCAFYTEWADNSRALAGMILFLCFFYGLLWPQKSIPMNHRRQRGIVEIIPEGGCSRVSERAIDQPVRKRVAAQPGARTPS
jgi:hypothetical protein